MAFLCELVGPKGHKICMVIAVFQHISGYIKTDSRLRVIGAITTQCVLDLRMKHAIKVALVEAEDNRHQIAWFIRFISGEGQASMNNGCIFERRAHCKRRQKIAAGRIG